MIYFDNSATTPLLPEVSRAMLDALEFFGNPSSAHALGIMAEQQLRAARETLAHALHSNSPEEIIVTGSGTEANNLAILGGMPRGGKTAGKIVTTAIEHDSVLAPIKYLEQSGTPVTVIKPDANGNISAQAIFNAVDQNTGLISIMLCNNETGAMLPVEAARQAVRTKNSPAVIHCDAIGAFGKMPVEPRKLGVDLLTINAHKIHGPKGVGALWKAKHAKLRPILHGGGQEQGFRPGTENLSLLAGFAAAVKAFNFTAHFEGQVNCFTPLSLVGELHALALLLLSKVGGVLNAPGGLPYVLNMSFPGVRSEVMVNFLSQRKIYVSAGSACKKGRQSHVLAAQGLPKNLLESAIRISFSRYNTVEEVHALAAAVTEAMSALRITRA